MGDCPGVMIDVVSKYCPKCAGKMYEDDKEFIEEIFQVGETQYNEEEHVPSDAEHVKTSRLYRIDYKCDMCDHEEDEEVWE